MPILDVNWTWPLFAVVITAALPSSSPVPGKLDTTLDILNKQFCTEFLMRSLTSECVTVDSIPTEGGGFLGQEKNLLMRLPDIGQEVTERDIRVDWQNVQELVLWRRR